MMATPHLLTGAAIGRVMRRPWLAYPAALVSHLLLDMVPHLDAHSLFGVPQGGPTRVEAAAAVADFAAGALLVGVLAWRARRHSMVLVALCAMLIDLVEYVPPVGLWVHQSAAAAGFIWFHHAIQHSLTADHWPLGLTTQLLVAGGATAVCLRGARAKITVGTAS